MRTATRWTTRCIRRSARGSPAPSARPHARSAGSPPPATAMTGSSDDLVDTARAAAAHGNDPARFERVLAAAKSPRDRNEQQRLLGALGTFTDPKLAQRALDLTQSPAFDLRDSIRILYMEMWQHETRPVAFAFIQAHLDDLLAHMRSDEAAGLLAGIVGATCDPERRKAMADLVKPRAAKFDGAQIVDAQALEQADQCIAELARNKAALEKFLR